MNVFAKFFSFLIYGAFTLCIFLISCNESDEHNASPKFYLPYELTDSDAKYRLPSKLVEISGLSCITDSTIACVQDEEGDVYIFNPIDGEVHHKINFGKDGDYEGVEYIDGSVYVIRSSGKLYEIQAFGTDNQTTTKHKLFLEKANNPEGVAYDPIHHRLLISAKGRPGDEHSIKEENNIYGFDLETKTLMEEPMMSFSSSDIYDFLGQSRLREVHDRATNFLLPGSIGILAFHPSGIAVHPISGNIYMVTSRGNLLIVLSHDGEILYICDLPETQFKKPEGITFLPNADLLIANEGLDGIANIRRFNYIKQID